MSRQVVVSDGAHAVLCDLAARMAQETGKAVSFAEALDSLLEEQRAS